MVGPGGDRNKKELEGVTCPSLFVSLARQASKSLHWVSAATTLVARRMRSLRSKLSIARSTGASPFTTMPGSTRGKTESWLGLGLKGRRDKAFVMTKVCTHGRDGSLAMQMLEQSLRRLQTDHLDLWQVHGVVFQNNPELFIRTGGAAEALLKAKQQSSWSDRPRCADRGLGCEFEENHSSEPQAERNRS